MRGRLPRGNGLLTGPAARTAPAELQPLAYGPQAEVPNWSCAAVPARLGLDRGTLSWFARFREQNDAGRKHLVRLQVLTQRQADALTRLERNLVELGCPGAWFTAGHSTKPWAVRAGIVEQILAGLDARPECALDLARACRLPDAAMAHQDALEKALIAHLQSAGKPPSRPASRSTKAAREAASLTLNDEKGLTTMAATATARATARATIVNLHATGVINLGEKLPTGWTTKMQSETGIDAQVWRITADTLRAKLDKLPAFGSQKDAVATENGSNGHAPAEPAQEMPKAPVGQVAAAAPLVTEPAPEPEVGMASLPTIIGDDCGHVWFASEGDACPRCALQKQLNNAVRERKGAEAVNEVFADALSQVCEQAGGDRMNWTAAGVVAVAQEALATAEVDRQSVARLETFVGKLAQQLGVEQGDQITAAVGALKTKAGYLDAAVENRNEALARVKEYQRILKGINEAIGGNVFDGTGLDELPELVRQKVGNLERDAEALRGPAAAMGELCALLKEPDPMKAALWAGDCATEAQDAHELLDRLKVDQREPEGDVASLRQRIAWLADQSRLPAEPVVPDGYVLLPLPTFALDGEQADQARYLASNRGWIKDPSARYAVIIGAAHAFQAVRR